MYHLQQTVAASVFSFTRYKLFKIHHKPLSLQVRFSGKTLTQNAQKIFDVQQQVTKATTTNPLRVYVSY